MSNWQTSLYILGILAAYLSGTGFERNSANRPAPNRSLYELFRHSTVTLSLVAAMLIPTACQFFYPELLANFRRDADAIFRGEWWRLVTALFFQDAGMGGAAFNLVALALVGRCAEQLWERRHVIGIFFFGAFVGEIAGLFWQPVGAGNSVGTFSLAAGIAVACLARGSTKPVRLLALVALGADIVLLLRKDIHGAAAIAGWTAALVLLWRGRAHAELRQ